MHNARFPLLFASLLAGLSSLGALPQAELKELRAELDEVVSAATLDAE